MNNFWFFIAICVAATCSLFSQQRPDALREYQAGNYSRAVEICTLELQESPGNMDSHTVLGWSLIRLGRYREALESGLQGLQYSRFDYRIVESVAEAHYFLGNHESALKYFQEYCVLAPLGTRIDSVYSYMAEIHIVLGEYHHADIALTTALHHNENSAHRWARLGYAREMAGATEYAEVAYQRALELDSTMTEASSGLGRIQQQDD